MQPKPIFLPGSNNELATFDMAKCKLIVRLNPHGVSSVFIIEGERVAYRVHDYDGERWRNALHIVGRFLADNPTH